MTVINLPEGIPIFYSLMFYAFRGEEKGKSEWSIIVTATQDSTPPEVTLNMQGIHESDQKLWVCGNSIPIQCDNTQY